MSARLQAACSKDLPDITGLSISADLLGYKTHDAHVKREAMKRFEAKTLAAMLEKQTCCSKDGILTLAFDMHDAPMNSIDAPNDPLR